MMMTVVVEHVCNGDYRLRRRPEQARVIVVGEDLPWPPHHRVERLGDTDAQPLHHAGERLGAVRLDDEMQVVALDAEGDHPQPESPRSRCKAGLQAAIAPPTAQVPDVLAHSQGDMDGQWLVELRSRLVRDERLRPLRLAPRSRPPTAVLRQWQGKLSRSLHDWGYIVSARSPQARPHANEPRAPNAHDTE